MTDIRDTAAGAPLDDGASSTGATDGAPAAEVQAETPVADATSDALAEVVRSLMQASQALVATATQISRTSQGLTGGATVEAAGQVPGGYIPTAPPGQINIWEDDPFSEAVPSSNPTNASTIAVDAPTISAPLLRVSIADPEPRPGPYDPGSANFRYWVAAEALARGISFWAPLLPAGTRWSTAGPNLRVSLTAGQALNAFYSRQAGLRFFQQTIRNVGVFSAESPDVVCHELGHAVLDALRPQLFHAASFEAAAFHEAFGDMCSILSALQLPTLRQKILDETKGRLSINSRLSRIAEQLGWAIRQGRSDAVDPDCLRNAANSFFYQQPERLPPSAPATELSSEAHSFARVFTGAFLDALAAMLTITGSANDANLQAVARDLGQLLADGVRIAPIVPDYFGQVAAAMIKADESRNKGRYRQALSIAFVQRGILSPLTIPDLDAAEAPHFKAAPAEAAASAVSSWGFGETEGAPMFLTYDGEAEDDGYRRGFEDAPELPTRPVAGDRLGLGTQLLVHAPAHTHPFAVVSAAPGVTSTDKPLPEEAALYFAQELIRQGRVDLGPDAGVAASLSAPTEEKTHEVADTPDGKILKRLHFDCGLCRRG